jgi:aconitate decarboxylase
LNLADRNSADSNEAKGKGIDGDGKWEVEKNTFKPFPCGIVIHPAIDGCAQLRSEGLDAATIESVQLSVHPLVLELTGKKFPKDGLEAKFSVYHGAACGFLFGKASPAEYSDEIVQRTAVLREKITATVDRDIRPDECRIVVDSSSGRHEKHVKHAAGSLAKPLTQEHLRQKFVDQVEPVAGKAEASKLFDDAINLRKVNSVSALIVT